MARRDGRLIVAGHQRVLAARRLGLTTVPVVFVDLSMDEGRLLGLALNRISGYWDEELLARLLVDLAAKAESDLSLSGFRDDEVRDLVRSLDRRERRERPEAFDVVEALAAAEHALARTRPGDLWLLGEHRLLCGDSTVPAAVARLMTGTSARMAFTDPPYNVAYGDHGGAGRGRRRRIANDALPPDEWAAFVRGWAAQLLASVEGALYVSMSSKEWPRVSLILEELGAHWSDTIIWAKDRFTLGRADYQRQYEPIWYGWREGSAHLWSGGRDQGDVWEIARPVSAPLHPTMKPLELVERTIENSSHPGDIVLDLFVGSGTTLIASERTGRRCFGMELSAQYCDVTVARWEAFSGERAVLANESGEALP